MGKRPFGGGLPRLLGSGGAVVTGISITSIAPLGARRTSPCFSHASSVRVAATSALLAALSSAPRASSASRLEAARASAALFSRTAS